MAGNGGYQDVIHFETRGTWIKKKIILKLHMYKENLVVSQNMMLILGAPISLFYLWAYISLSTVKS